MREPDPPPGLEATTLDGQGLDPGGVLEQVRRDRAAERRPGTEPPSIEELGKSFPDHALLGLIGQGGMGVVYRAWHRRLERDVAIKILPRSLGNLDPTFEERFAREARALALLEHPHILRVFDFGQADGWFYLVTEFVDGANLRQMMRLEQVTPEEALRLVPQVCSALAFAHGKGVVHRDVKPENILVDAAGDAKIADFGLAKIVGDSSDPGLTLTGSRQVLGTPHYMAPEQIEQPTLVDHRADIFSLGVVLYEMLTGQLPIGRFEEPSARNRSAGRFDVPVMRSLERSPENRYQSAEALRADLEADPGVTKARSKAEPVAAKLQKQRVARERAQAASHRAVLFVAVGAQTLLCAYLVGSPLLTLASLVALWFASSNGFSALRTPYLSETGGASFIAVVLSTWIPVVLAGNFVFLLAFALVLASLGAGGQPRDLFPLLGIADVLVLAAAVLSAYRARVPASRRAREPRSGAPSRLLTSIRRSARVDRLRGERWARGLMTVALALAAALLVWIGAR